jgi:hypothetical protein
VVAAERAMVAHAQARLPEDLAAERRALVDDCDVQPERGGLDGGGEPCRAAADDEEVVRLAA